jgi:hypothetical protein
VRLARGEKKERKKKYQILSEKKPKTQKGLMGG